MEWSTVAFFGISVLAVLCLLYLLVAIYTARIASRQMERMNRDFEERRRNPFGDRPRQ